MKVPRQIGCGTAARRVWRTGSRLIPSCVVYFQDPYVGVMSLSQPREHQIMTSHRRRRSHTVCVERLERRDCPAALFTLEQPASPIIEGDRATFTVRLAAPSSQSERVLVSTVAESATLGRDYIFQNSQQLLFAPGVTSRQFTINTISDSIREGVETLRIVVTPMSRPAAQSITGRASIYDLVPTSISVSDIRVTEGNAGTTLARFTVNMTAGAILPVTVNYATQDGTATAGADYTATSGSLTFAPGELVKTVSVPILGDRVGETDETFHLRLTNASRGTTIRTPQATCTIANDETDQPGFQISVQYITSFYGEVPAGVRFATQQAVQRWEQVITGDLPGHLEQSTGMFVDDFRMRVQMGLLGGGSDGGGRVLANAMPLQYRTGDGLPWLGETGIDPADATSSQLVAILTHEIGHALGFASSNPSFTRWVSGFTWTGPNAVREYRSLAGASMTSVPLESGGGMGTAGAHWSEAVFRTELMTGFVEPAGVPMPLSRVTVGAFADLGYTVNYAAADVFVLPASISTPPANPPSPPRANPRSPANTSSRPAASLPRPALPAKPASSVATSMFAAMASGESNGSINLSDAKPEHFAPWSSLSGRSLASSLISRR